MAGKTIGGLDVTTKERFDARQALLGAGSANEAMAALLDMADGNDVMSAFDDIEVAGVKEVKRIITNAARQMVLVLAHRYDEQQEVHAADAELIDALKRQVAACEEEHIRDVADIAERDATIAELQAKANSVDALAEQVKAQGERMGKLIDRFDKEAERHEAAEAKLTAERDELAEQVKSVTSERDTLAAEVERLTAELAEVKAGK